MRKGIGIRGETRFLNRVYNQKTEGGKEEWKPVYECYMYVGTGDVLAVDCSIEEEIEA